MSERPSTLLEAIIARFRDSFGDEFRTDELMGRYTTSGLGGPADFFVTVHSAEQLMEAVMLARKQHIRFWVLGGGSNVLVADAGIRGLVIRNRAREVHFHHNGIGVVLRAESGVNFASLARQSASRGLAGLEWAAGVPGTVGGAVVNNAGTHEGDVAHSLRLATILDSDMQVRDFTPDQLGYQYRSSTLKRSHRGPGDSDRVVLAAEFHLKPAPVDELEAKLATLTERRKNTQPPGASMGCMFKNPAGDHAGRLLDEAGLKGTRMGGAVISPVHANFFVNEKEATAEDVRRLMARAWHVVKEKYDVELEPEVELIGDWG